MTDFPTHFYTSTCEIPTLLYTWSLKKVPLSGGAYREYPLGNKQSREINGFTMKKGYARNVCDFSQDDTDIFLRYQFFYFHFLLNIPI